MKEKKSENEKNKTRTFILLPLTESEKEERNVFTSKTPRDAAMKAASKGKEHIVIIDVENQKMHIFKGEKTELKKETEYTKKYNITCQSNVTKMAYGKLDRHVSITNEEDSKYLLQKYNEIVS